MKRFFTKKMLALMCMMTCIFVMTACSQKNETQNKIIDESGMKSSAEYNIQVVNGYSDDELNQLKEAAAANENTMLETLIDSLLTVREECGAYVSTGDNWSYEFGDNTATVSVTTVYGERNVKFSMTFEKAKNGSTEISSAKFETIYTMGELIAGAAANMVIGMSIVFIVLILMVGIISCFKYIPAIQDKLEKKIADRKAKKEKEKKKKKTMPDPTPRVTPAMENVQEEENLTDDLELVAVITAAIAAMENTSADGLVVRSIKRSANNNKWKRA